MESGKHTIIYIHIPLSVEQDTDSVSYFCGNGDSFAISLHWHQNLRVLDEGIIP